MFKLKSPAVESLLASGKNLQQIAEYYDVSFEWLSVLQKDEGPLWRWALVPSAAEYEDLLKMFAVNDWSDKRIHAWCQEHGCSKAWYYRQRTIWRGGYPTWACKEEPLIK